MGSVIQLKTKINNAYLELKNSVAVIDKVSKSFDAQRARAIIPVANAQQKVLAAKNKELSADAALLALQKKGSNASEDDIKNAKRAQEIAIENTRNINKD